MTTQNTQTFHEGWTGHLRRAIHANDMEGIQQSLEQNADPDGQISEGNMSFLDYAAKQQQVHVIATLIEFGAVADDECLRHLAKIAGGDGTLPIHAAVSFEMHKALTRFFKAGVDVDTPDLKNGWSPLMFAAGLGAVSAVRLLLDAGADIERRIETGAVVAGQRVDAAASPLAIACGAGHEGVVQVLLDAGASIDVPFAKVKGKVVQSLLQFVNHVSNKEIQFILHRHKAKATETALTRALPLAGTTRRARL